MVLNEAEVFGTRRDDSEPMEPAAGHVRSEWARTSRRYRDSEFNLRRLKGEWAAFMGRPSDTDRPGGPPLAFPPRVRIPVPELRFEDDDLGNGIYKSRHNPYGGGRDEQQYLGNGGRGHWSNPRSHD